MATVTFTTTDANVAAAAAIFADRQGATGTVTTKGVLKRTYVVTATGTAAQLLKVTKGVKAMI